MNQNDGNENRKQKGRRQLGGGATVAEDFNEEAAAKRFQRLIESDGGRQIRIESDDVGSNGRLSGKYSKRRRSNVAVIIVRVVFIGSFLFQCLLLNHSFPTNPNKITNCFKLILLCLQLLQTTFAQCVRLF